MNALSPDYRSMYAPCLPVARPRSRAAMMAEAPFIARGAPPFSDLIVAIAQRGDRDAFATLFGHFAPRVKRYLMRLGAAAEPAEELAQETLLTVWRKASAFDPSRAAASTWIFTIARNLRIDMARRDNRPPPQVDPSTPILTPETPDAVLSAAQDQDSIRRAIATLSREQAQVIALAFFSDKPHSEIAVDLGLPLGTVKSRLRLALARLRAHLEAI